MLKYFGPKRPRASDESFAIVSVEQPPPISQAEKFAIDPNDIEFDPGLRKPIHSFNVNVQEYVRSKYMATGPCQPKGLDFPRKLHSGGNTRAFRDNWYEKFDWLEYSVAKDSAFCFYCFLFKDNVKDNEVFTKIGMSNWKDALEKFRTHVGSVGSEHNKARIKFENYKKEKDRLSFIAQSNKRREEARQTRLTATLDVIRFLLQQGLPMREHNELLKWYGVRNDEVGSVILDDSLETSQMISPQMQKDMVSACASETTLAILDDLGNRLFSILVSEAFGRMVVFIRYINKCGQVVERFLGLVHVKETSTKCLKEDLDSLFLKHGLSLSRLRGQGYDGSSNMREEFNGLKELILRENSCAWYMHCFAHQLQSIIVAICKANRYACDFLNCLAMIVDACGSPCKRANELQQLEHIRNMSELENGANFLGNGKNKEACLKQQSGTRWGPMNITLIRLKDMWPTVIQVLEDVFEDGIEHETSAWVRSLLKQMHSFEFVFSMIFMKNLLGMTDKLSMVLEEGDQHILNIIIQIRCVKKDLHQFRDFGWDKLLEEVKGFCAVNQIPVINMEDVVPKLVRVERDGKVVTNFHHYYAEIFSEVLQSVLEEIDHRFSEVSIELLDCLACLDPKNSFSNFNVDKLCRLANLYPDDFSRTDCSYLPQELHNFLSDMKEDKRFHDVDSLKSLARKMKETRKDSIFQLVYRLVELVLLLPVATPSVDRVFSTMEHLKTDFKDRMEDELLSDSLVVFMEREIFEAIDNDIILQRFQKTGALETEKVKSIKTEFQ